MEQNEVKQNLNENKNVNTNSVNTNEKNGVNTNSNTNANLNTSKITNTNAENSNTKFSNTNTNRGTNVNSANANSNTGVNASASLNVGINSNNNRNSNTNLNNNHFANSNRNIKENRNQIVNKNADSNRFVTINKNVNTNHNTNSNAEKNAVINQEDNQANEEIEISYDDIISDLKLKQQRKESLKNDNKERKSGTERYVEKKEISNLSQTTENTDVASIQRKEINPSVFNTKRARGHVNNKNVKMFNGDSQNGDNKIKKEIVALKKNPKALRIYFLGGVGEIGKNMTVLEYGDEIIVIDAGLSFPSENMPGIDVVVPDITYLIQNKEKIKAIFLTHGHEDHIGGLPYVLNDIHCPVYGTKLTLALVQNKLREHPKCKMKSIEIIAKQKVNVGCFTVEALKVSHSIAGSLAFSVNTPVGVVFFTGDFKIDYQPIDGSTTDLTRMAELGQQGVLLLLCESTNVERPGYSMSEKSVGASLDILFAKNSQKRIFIATFASNIHRIQQIMDLAEKHKRKVAFSGRSMLNNMDVASKIGELKFNKNNIIDVDKIDAYKDNELVIITTGSQGEPMSALTRIASGEFNKVKVGENDCIILSSSPIPGNEKAINNTINALYRQGADVIYDSLADIHVSGHAYQEELKLVHSLLKAKYFIPIHGEYKHFKHHKDLALSMGMKDENIRLVDIGTCIELTPNSIDNIGYVESGSRLVDGYGIGELDSNVLKDRINLSEEGICVTVMTIDMKKGMIKNGPEIITRGLIYSYEASALVEEARSTIRDLIKSTDMKTQDIASLRNLVRKTLSSYFNKKTKRNPTILTVIYEG